MTIDRNFLHFVGNLRCGSYQSGVGSYCRINYVPFSKEPLDKILQAFYLSRRRGDTATANLFLDKWMAERGNKQITRQISALDANQNTERAKVKCRISFQTIYPSTDKNTHSNK